MDSCDMSGECLRPLADRRTVETGAEQTRPKVPGTTPIRTGNINAVLA
jgi:hypothetical protein